MRFLSLFSGIEAASVAWLPLDWEAVAFSEIDPFACAVLGHRYPSVPNLGDVTAITQHDIIGLGPVDIAVFGFPCQDLSVAGLRKGLHDGEGNATRSGLFFDAMRVVEWSGSRWALAENVPGLLSSHDGRDFASVVGTMAGTDVDVPESGWRNSGVVAGPRGLVEWVVLDAQWFGVPQRRRRVFIVRDSGDWRGRPPLFLEPYSLQGNPPPRREAGASVAGSITRRIDRGGVNSEGHDAHLIAHSLRADEFDASEDGTGRGTPLVAVDLRNGVETGDTAMPVQAGGHGPDPGGTPHVLVACIHPDAIGRDGVNKIPGPDAEGRVRLRDAGLGVIEDGTSYTLPATGVPAIAYQCGGSNVGPMGTVRGTPLVAVDLRNGVETGDTAGTLQAKKTGYSLNAAPGVMVPMAFDVKRGLAPHGAPVLRETAAELTASDHKDPQIVACTLPTRNGGVSSGYHPVVAGEAGEAVHLNADSGRKEVCGVSAVRRLTPL